jgi:hypothetical protein
VKPGTLLRNAVEEGAVEQLTQAYAGEARLDASLPGARRVATGPAEIGALISEWWSEPGALEEFAVAEFDGGAAAWLERVDGDGRPRRQRHYLRTGADGIKGHWIYAAPPRTPPAGAAPADTAAPGPEVLEGLGDVRALRPMTSTGWSGAALWWVELAGGDRLVAKHVVGDADWLARATGAVAREGLFFADGVYARMPQAIDPAVVSAAPGDGGWWVVSRDVSTLLLDADSVIPRATSRAILAAANDMWDEFWGERVPNASTLRDRLHFTAPSIADVERDGADLLPKQFEAAWAAFSEAVGDDIGDSIVALVEEPGPLVRALDSCGTTLLHGDLRDENIGMDGDRLVVLDWGIATQGHPVVELAWYLMHDAWRIDASQDQIVEDFRAVRGQADDPSANALLGVVGLVEYGWILGHSAIVHPDPAERAWAREELDWWVPLARRGLESIGGTT